MAASAHDARTVPVRVQVIDLQPRIVDLVVPAYLGADDLAQRVAWDLGLGAWWEDGARRRFWLRARGRVLGPDERLHDLGVVPYELVHLLPEPRAGVVVAERTAPVEEAPTSTASRVGRIVALLAVAGAWALASTAVPSPWLAGLGGVGVAWLAGAVVVRAEDAGLGLALRTVALASMVGAPAVALLGRAWWAWAPVAVCGLLVGAALAWLAWLGDLERTPLPIRVHGPGGEVVAPREDRESGP
jgi:hypothetical protein